MKYLATLVGVCLFSLVAQAEPCRSCSPARSATLTPRFPRLFAFLHPDAKFAPAKESPKKDDKKKDTPKKK